MRTTVAILFFSIIMTFCNVLRVSNYYFLAYLLMVVVAFTLARDISVNKKTNRFTVPLLVGYVIRISLLIFDLYGKSIMALPNSGADTEMFYLNACNYVITHQTARGLFPKVMGTIFSFTGTSRVYGQFLVVMFSMVALIMFALILNELKVDSIVKSRTMWIVCLLPNFAIMSSIFLRESLVCMFATISIYCFVLWIHRKKELWFLLAFAMSFMGALFHSGLVGIAGGMVLVRLIYNNRTGRMQFTWKSVVVAVVFFAVFVLLFQNYGDLFFEKMGGTTSVQDIANMNTEGGSSYSAYVGDSSSISSMIVYTIPRIVYFLFSPFPWQWRGISDVIAFLFSGLFYLVTVVNIVKYLLKNRQINLNRSEIIILSIVTFCVVFIFAWGVSNVGTAVRHRDKLILIFATLYALTYDRRYGIKISWGRKRIM